MSTGKNSNLDVASVMLDLSFTPRISNRALLKEALDLMDEKRLGIICIIDGFGKLEGVITDGDIRRMLTRVQKPFAALFNDDVIEHAVKNPVTVNRLTPVSDAVATMGLKQIWDLPVIDQNGNLEGLLHLHPAIEAILGVRNV
jgi:CBS domain-containing protein